MFNLKYIKMELQNLSNLVYGYEKTIKELTEKRKNLVFDYCKEQGFEDGKRYIYDNPESPNNGKLYEVVFKRPLDCRIILNCIDGARVFIKCYPVKKDGSRTLIGETELYINDLIVI